MSYSHMPDGGDGPRGRGHLVGPHHGPGGHAVVVPANLKFPVYAQILR